MQLAVALKGVNKLKKREQITLPFDARYLGFEQPGEDVQALERQAFGSCYKESCASALARLICLARNELSPHLPPCTEANEHDAEQIAQGWIDLEVCVLQASYAIV